jgi:hypothetical protein
VVTALRLAHAGTELEKLIGVSRVCEWLEVPRSTAYYIKQESAPRQRPAQAGSMPEGFLLGLIYAIIQAHPTFGIRHTWAMLKFSLGVKVNRKRGARLMRREGWR